MKTPSKPKRIICGTKGKDIEYKCGGCNWESCTFYTLSGQKIKDDGLCAFCFLDALMNQNAKILLD